ncbi:unannotated protein [freshwater metagenome]|uniref:Unannotated protein n=1 Tax=freshwater metagenome TaxID=449393 RepID=A0A6J5ZSQ3_9ZZZZ
MPNLTVIPARGYAAARMKAGQHLKVINTFGQQVIDFWAFRDGDLSEYMSMHHTHASLCKIIPSVGDSLVTTKRRAIMTITQDTTPGIHDTLMPSCDRYRYQQLGCTEYHLNCKDNLAMALDDLDLDRVVHPAPFNLFMNIPVHSSDNNTISWEPSPAGVGEFITMRAEIDAVVAFSSCPQDIVPINGPNCEIQDTHFEIY